jgi:hypothetical protein
MARPPAGANARAGHCNLQRFIAAPARSCQVRLHILLSLAIVDERVELPAVLEQGVPHTELLEPICNGL